ncbi:hypothetical protein GOV10_01050 [Candidatus Woesearchaeota archaeon]|nr:hypothetical protein [Candidatus Woesearchaeota archaeon]
MSKTTDYLTIGAVGIGAYMLWKVSQKGEEAVNKASQAVKSAVASTGFGNTQEVFNRGVARDPKLRVNNNPVYGTGTAFISTEKGSLAVTPEELHNLSIYERKIFASGETEKALKIASVRSNLIGPAIRFALNPFGEIFTQLLTRFKK